MGFSLDRSTSLGCKKIVFRNRSILINFSFSFSFAGTVNHYDEEVKPRHTVSKQMHWSI